MPSRSGPTASRSSWSLTDLLLRQPVTTWKGAGTTRPSRPAPRRAASRARACPSSSPPAAPEGCASPSSTGRRWVTVGDPGPGGRRGADRGGRGHVAAQLAEALDEACAEGGRDPSTLDRIVLTGLNLDSGLGSVDEFEDTLGRYAEPSASPTSSSTGPAPPRPTRATKPPSSGSSSPASDPTPSGGDPASREATGSGAGRRQAAPPGRRRPADAAAVGPLDGGQRAVGRARPERLGAGGRGRARPG